jgi:hypothetical protein
MGTWKCLLGVLILAGGLAACGDSASSPTSVSAPTRTLVPPTATPTPEPVTPTITPTDFPAPSTLAAAGSTDDVAVIPPAAQRLIELATTDLIDTRGLDAAAVRLMSLDAFTWPDAGLGCDGEGGGDTALGQVDGYRIVFTAGTRIFVYHTDGDAAFVLCADPGWMAREGQPLPLDPIADSMVEQVQRDAARRLDVAQTRVRLVSLLTMTWPDASVGCPQPEIDYADVETPGYRIVVRADDQTLIYHTSIRHFVPCVPEDEVLPGMLRRALPTPTPEPAEE